MTEARDLAATLAVIEANIVSCVNVRPKFAEGSPQDTLLKNRIKALEISASLLENKANKSRFSKDELQAAQAPIQSIMHKSEKAILKFKPGHPAHTRLDKLIAAMKLSESALNDAIENRITRIFRRH